MFHSTIDAFRSFEQNKNIFDSSKTLGEYLDNMNIKTGKDSHWLNKTFKSAKVNPYYRGHRNLELPEVFRFNQLFTDIKYCKENPNPKEYIFISDNFSSLLINSSHYSDNYQININKKDNTFSSLSVRNGKLFGFYKLYGRPKTKFKKLIESYSKTLSALSVGIIKRSDNTILVTLSNSKYIGDTYIANFPDIGTEMHCISLESIELYYQLEKLKQYYMKPIYTKDNKKYVNTDKIGVRS